MRNLQVVILVAVALLLFMSAARVLVRRARLRRSDALRAQDVAAISGLVNEGGRERRS